MRTLLLLCAGLVLCGCASQTKALGVWDLPDGQTINLYQTKSRGMTGPSITAIGAFLCTPVPERPQETGHADVACDPLQGYHASGPGLVESMTGGLMGSVIQAGVAYGVGTALVRQHSQVVAQEGEKNRDVVVKENNKKIKADRETAKESKGSVTVVTPPVTVIAPVGPKGDKGDKGDKGAK